MRLCKLYAMANFENEITERNTIFVQHIEWEAANHWIVLCYCGCRGFEQRRQLIFIYTMLYICVNGEQ